MKYLKKTTSFLIIIYLFCVNVLSAQDTIPQPNKKPIDSTTLYKTDIEELYKLKPLDKGEQSISITGFKSTTLRESPGIVTLILGDEIRNSGAKDLFDVLRNVPGFDFALDLTPILTVRGNSAHEAKLLLLLDGQQINDVSLGYSFVFQRFPLNNIERIEIIRGAGSAIYGGMAGLAVINIITKRPTKAQEVSVSSVVGTTTPTTVMRNNLEAYALTKFVSGLEMSISGYYMEGKATDRNINASGLYDNFIDFKANSTTQSSGFNVGIKFKQLDIRLMQNTIESRLPQLANARLTVNGLFFSIGYRFDIGDKLAIYSRLNLKQHNPYLFTDIPLSPQAFFLGTNERLDILNFSNTKDRRIALTNYAVYQATKNITLTGGVDVYLDKAKYVDASQLFTNSANEISYQNIGLFAEASIKSKIGNFTLGARFDKYTNIPSVVVPRVAFTRAFRNIHVKALYTQAFKTPTITNIQYKVPNTDILPERYELIELEAGLRLSDKLQLNFNAYNIYIQNVITRADIASPTTGVRVEYSNVGASGTRGVEAEGKYNQKWGYIKFGYSFYETTVVQDTLQLLIFPKVTAGIPAQKATLQAHIKLNKNISFNPGIMYLTQKLNFNQFGTSLNDLAKKYPSELHLNVFVNYDSFLVKNLSFGVGINNITNEQFWLIPWKIDNASNITQTLPGRELYFRLIYNLKN